MNNEILNWLFTSSLSKLLTSLQKATDAHKAMVLHVTHPNYHQHKASVEANESKIERINTILEYYVSGEFTLVGGDNDSNFVINLSWNNPTSAGGAVHQMRLMEGIMPLEVTAVPTVMYKYSSLGV